MTNLVARPESLSLAGGQPAAPLVTTAGPWVRLRAIRCTYWSLSAIFFPYFSNVVVGDPRAGRPWLGM